MRKSSAAFSIVDSAGGYTGTQEAGCRATLAIVVVPQCVLIVVVVLILSSSLTMQLAFRQQSRLHLDELPFIKKLLQQLVQRQATATCKSFQATSLFVLTLTTVVSIPGATAHSDDRRRRWWVSTSCVSNTWNCYSEDGSQAVVCRPVDERLTDWQFDSRCRRVDLLPAFDKLNCSIIATRRITEERNASAVRQAAEISHKSQPARLQHLGTERFVNTA